MAKEILMMFSTMLDKKDIVDQLKQQCEQFSILGEKADEKKLGIWCMVYLMHESSGGDYEKMKKILKKWDDAEKFADMFENKN